MQPMSGTAPTRPTRFYDASARRLIYVDRSATPEFWDSNWEDQQLSRDALLHPQPTQWSRITQEFLAPSDGPVLEGGCGPGAHVAAMRDAGYTVVGVDFALRTVQRLNETAPELDIRLGDVRRLDFENEYFAGYWSLGVIEHFWEGYGEIVAEAHRVLKPGGLFFLAFPYLNAARAWQGRLRLIPKWDGTRPDGFYQFALNTRTVQSELEVIGFELVERRSVLARQGLAEELPGFSRTLESLYARQCASVATRIARRLLHEAALRMLPFTSYSDLLVLRKKPAPVD